MPRDFRPDAREFAVISRLDQAKEAERTRALLLLRKHLDELSNRIAIRLIERRLVETTSKEELEEQLHGCLQRLLTADEFEVQYQVANLRNLLPRPNFIGLFVTAFVVEQLINHRSIVDIYGTDEEIYHCVTGEIERLIPTQR